MVRVRDDGLCVARDLLLKPEQRLPACLPQARVVRVLPSAQQMAINPCGAGVAATCAPLFVARGRRCRLSTLCVDL